MSGKLLGILFILLFVMGCQPEPTTVSSAHSTVDNSPTFFDTAPVAYDIFPASFAEDTESGWIYLSYSDEEGHPATSCQISGRSFVNVTSPCSCSFGICSLKVKGFENYNGLASFRFSVIANNQSSQTGLASFFITSVQDPPVANDLELMIIENTTYTSNGTISFPHLSGSDPDGNTLTCLKVSDPLRGSATVNSNCSFTYTPIADYEGVDSFTFKVNDGTTDSQIATVTFRMLKQNEPPVATNFTITTYQNIPLTFSLQSTDVDDDPLVYNIVTRPTRGTLTGTGVQRTYTPQANYIGNDSFTFSSSDGFLTSNIATVTILVLPTTIYLSTTGFDSTAERNNPSRPFRTAQAAAISAASFSPTSLRPVIIQVAPGTYGNVTLMQDFGSHITWRGSGRDSTIIGNISVNCVDGSNGTQTGDKSAGGWDGAPGGDGKNLEIVSDFNLTFGNISANGGNGGLHAPDTTTFLSRPGAPGVGGAITLAGHFGTVSALGGSGHGGGKGGTILLRTNSTSGTINVSGGQDLCTIALSCPTSVNSAGGGSVLTEASTTVTGDIIAKGGANNGLAAAGPRMAGTGGDILIRGRVTGNVSADGGDSYDSQVGEGGYVRTESTAVIDGSISVITGVYSNDGEPSYAGDVDHYGSALHIFARSHPTIFGGAGQVNVYGTATNVHVESHNSNCDYSKSGKIFVHPDGDVTNAYAQGGSAYCSTNTSGEISISGRVTALATVDGGSKVLSTDTPGKAGKITVNANATVNNLSARGASAPASSCQSGGEGGSIEVFTGATYNPANFSVDGGAGDTVCVRPDGPAGTITIN